MPQGCQGVEGRMGMWVVSEEWLAVTLEWNLGRVWNGMRPHDL